MLPSASRNDAGNIPGANAATTLKPYAALVPIAISVNMFSFRRTIEATPRSKNGQPPHKTTGVESANSIQVISRMERKCCRGLPGIKSDIAIRKIGVVSATLAQKWRVMEISSAFGGSARVAVRGSSAIPQIGHVPGASRTISGCIGQTYSVIDPG